MGWLRKRFGERSTANGSLILTGLLTMYFGPAQAEVVATALLTVLGAYEAVRRES